MVVLGQCNLVMLLKYLWAPTDSFLPYPWRKLTQVSIKLENEKKKKRFEMGIVDMIFLMWPVQCLCWHVEGAA